MRTQSAREYRSSYIRLIYGVAALGLALLLSACIPPAAQQPVSPPPVVLASPLIDTAWLLEEVRLEGEVRDFSLTTPVTARFFPDGTASLDFACGLQIYLVTFDQSNNTYRLVHRAFAGSECGLDAEHSHMVESSFAATTQFTVEEDRLTLTGEGLTMEFVAQQD